MKTILAAIFIVGMSASFIAGNREARIHGVGKYDHDITTCALGTTCTVSIGSITFADDSAVCPWWIDPELWWNQNCTGGMPPRLPIPNGLTERGK